MYLSMHDHFKRYLCISLPYKSSIRQPACISEPAQGDMRPRRRKRPGRPTLPTCTLPASIPCEDRSGYAVTQDNGAAHFCQARDSPTLQIRDSPRILRTPTLICIAERPRHCLPVPQLRPCVLLPRFCAFFYKNTYSPTSPSTLVRGSFILPRFI